jgi:hypothetical protein
MEPLLMIRPPCGVLRLHPREGGTRAIEDAVDVHVNHSAEPGRIDFVRGCRRARPLPALLKSTSIRPQASAAARSKLASTAAASVTSQGKNQRRLDACRGFGQCVSARRPRSATRQPSSRKRRAVARPIPLPAPVMTMVLQLLFTGCSFRIDGSFGHGDRALHRPGSGSRAGPPDAAAICRYQRSTLGKPLKSTSLPFVPRDPGEGRHVGDRVVVAPCKSRPARCRSSTP